MSLSLDDVLSRLNRLTPADLKAVERDVLTATGSMCWVPNPGPQTAAYLSPADRLLFGGEGGGGKALALDTPLPTPGGWATMGDIQPGDCLFDDRGELCVVTAATGIMFDRPCYRVLFSDGSSIVADAHHQWVTLTQTERDTWLKHSDEWRAKRRAARPSRAVAVSQKPWVSKTISAANKARVHQCKVPSAGTARTTEAIAATLKDGRGFNHSVAVSAAIDCLPVALPIDPYTLGAWLGDGSSASAAITSADMGVVEAIASAGHSITKHAAKYAYGIGGLQSTLRSVGVLGNKHIPAAYLRASTDQRLALLQGLMDTDGTCETRGQCEFTTTKRVLADGVYELITSLGIKVVIREGVAKLRGRVIGPKFTLKFLTEKPAFRLARKLIRQKRGGFRGTHNRRYIVGCEPIPSVPVRCIQVDSPSSLFLAGRAMIPTHNSGLVLGLALTAHQRSLVMRRQYSDLNALTEEAIRFNGTRAGFNGSPPPKLRTQDGRLIEFGAAAHAGDEENWQGQAHDLLAFDEAVHFLESQVRFLMGWVRSTDPNQRCRTVMATNPPLTASGQWIIGMFRPWLDITYPKPAKDGELRWFVTAPDGEDVEVEDATPRQMDGKILIPESRTFIRSHLSDNPFLRNTGYQARLDAMPEPLRSAVRDGNFMAARGDAEMQVIPMAWILAAEARWTADGGKGVPMTAMALDPAGGGRDSAEIACRHGGWYAPLVSAKGEQTADGSITAAQVMRWRRDQAPVVVDVGGGYASGVILRLKDNGVPHIAFNGASSSTRRTKDGSLTFANKRSEAWWRFAEELDPDQEGGSVIALPPDPELRGDLAAPTYTLGPRGIQVESKVVFGEGGKVVGGIRKRLGRSPGKGDAVVMAMSEGARAVLRQRAGIGYAHEQGWDTHDSRPKVVMGRMAQRRN